MSSEINARLRQQASYGQQREYQIVNGRNIRVSISSKGNSKVFTVPMLALAEKGKARVHIAWAWFWLGLVGLLAILIYLGIKDALNLNAQYLNFAILAGLVVTTIIGFVMLVLNFSRKRVYFTAISKIPLFDILIGKPDTQSYKQFLEIFDSYLQKTRSHYDLRTDQQIAGEIRMLRRLSNEGVVSQKAYESAKDKLFSINK